MQTLEVQSPRVAFLGACLVSLVLDEAWWWGTGRFFPSLAEGDVRVPFAVVFLTITLVGCLLTRSWGLRLCAMLGALAGTFAAFGVLFLMFLQVGS